VLWGKTDQCQKYCQYPQAWSLPGHTLAIRAEGDDASAAVQALVALLENKFDEE
jgi:hypothetical protein